MPVDAALDRKIGIMRRHPVDLAVLPNDLHARRQRLDGALDVREKLGGYALRHVVLSLR
jgi:hypothetical protein